MTSDVSITVTDKKTGKYVTNVSYTSPYGVTGTMTDDKFAEFMNNLQKKYPDCDLEYECWKRDF